MLVVAELLMTRKARLAQVLLETQVQQVSKLETGNRLKAQKPQPQLVFRGKRGSLKLPSAGD